MIDDFGEYEWIECPLCGGNGDDAYEWDGRCTYCNGFGEVLSRFDEDEDDWDDA